MILSRWAQRRAFGAACCVLRLICSLERPGSSCERSGSQIFWLEICLNLLKLIHNFGFEYRTQKACLIPLDHW